MSAPGDSWIELTDDAPPDSIVERLSWERGKLRSALVRTNASGIDELFERRTWAGVPEFRLALRPGAIRIP